ncbi:MAG: response regulator [Candidatus Firestonebacteria bacterium]|nr:response regulator [Candidatus Firestonebacteria bacterium]
MSAKPSALIVDDEKPIRRLLRLALEHEGFLVREAENGQQGLIDAASQKPEIIILDLGLPDLDGLQVLKRLREWSRIPVLILSVKQEVGDKVAALDLGADDYLTKPFHTEELLARLRALRRHAHPEPDQPVFKSGTLVVDLVRRTAGLKGKELHLTPTEYSLLCVLIRHAGKIVTHRQLLHDVWGPAAEEQSQYLRVYMAHLRKKIETDPASPRLLINEPGIGYRLMVF